MGGVDLDDMRTTTYARLMKGWTWYLKLFFQLLDVCVLNSFIQYQMWPNSKGKDENMMIFRSDVIKGLHGGRSHQKDGRYQEPVLAVPWRLDSSLRHHPGKIAQLREYKVHIQGVLTPYTCAVCNVSMCPAPCLRRYHSMGRYLYDEEEYSNSTLGLRGGRGRPCQAGRPRNRRSNAQLQ